MFLKKEAENFCFLRRLECLHQSGGTKLLQMRREAKVFGPFFKKDCLLSLRQSQDWSVYGEAGNPFAGFRIAARAFSVRKGSLQMLRLSDVASIFIQQVTPVDRMML